MINVCNIHNIYTYPGCLFPTIPNILQIAVKEAREYIDTYFARFPGVKKHTEETIESARELGYVQTMLGRRRYIPEIASANRNIRQFAERAAVNMPIQGSAADIMKLAMIRIAPMLKSTSGKLLLQVHDELVLEVSPQDAQAIAQIVREGMEQAYKLLVPVKVDVKIGKNWSEMEGI